MVFRCGIVGGMFADVGVELIADVFAELVVDVLADCVVCLRAAVAGCCLVMQLAIWSMRILLAHAHRC